MCEAILDIQIDSHPEDMVIHCDLEDGHKGKHQANQPNYYRTKWHTIEWVTEEFDAEG